VVCIIQTKDYGRAPTAEEQKIATYNGYKFLTAQFPPPNLEVYLLYIKILNKLYFILMFFVFITI
jgi:hypothetical protein